MYGGQNMLKRLISQMECRSQQQNGSINDSQAFLIHLLMERVLKQGDTIAEMETTLVDIKNSLSAFKSVIQKVETNTSLSIPNLLAPIKNQVDQIPVLKKEMLELQNKVEILQTSLEQFKIEQYKRNNKTNTNCWLNKLFGFTQTGKSKKGKGIPAVLERTGLDDTKQEGETQDGMTSTGVKQDGNTVTMTKTELQTLIFVALLTGGIIGSLLLMLTK